MRATISILLLSVFFSSCTEKEHYYTAENAYKNDSLTYALSEINLAISNDERLFDSYHLRAKIKKKQKDIYGYILDLDSALILDKNNTELLKDKAADLNLYRYQLSSTTYSTSDEIIDTYDKLVNIYESEPDEKKRHLYSKAIFTSDPNQQLKLLDECLRIDSTMDNVYNARGHIFNKLLLYQKAIESYLKSIELGGNQHIHVNVGDTYLKLNNKEKACQHFQMDYDYSLTIEGMAEYYMTILKSKIKENCP